MPTRIDRSLPQNAQSNQSSAAAPAVRFPGPCGACSLRRTCKQLCDEMERLVTQPRTGRREHLSPKAIEFRNVTCWDSSDPDESALPRHQDRPREDELRAAMRVLKFKERVMIEQVLEGTPQANIANNLRISRKELTKMMTKTAAKVTRELGPSRRCAVAGCSSPVSEQRPRRKDLAPYCNPHRQQHAIAPSSKAKPDHGGAKKLVRPHCSASYVDISPSLALALLERNVNNRRLEPDRVEMYARDMASGDWRQNNQGIAVGQDGTLHDGQHRLWAVVKSGCTINMLVVAGVAATARATIDQGRARTVGDALRIFDGQAHGACITAWLRAIALMTAGRSIPMSHAVARREMVRFETSITWFLENGPRVRPYSRASVVGALLYAHAVAPEVVEPFTRRYVSGAHLDEASPVLALRNYAAERMQRDRPRAISLKTLGCVLAEHRGESLDRLPPAENALQYFQNLHATRGDVPAPEVLLRAV